MPVLSAGKHGRVPLYVIDAKGGPPTRGRDPRMAEIPTTSGTYIIGDIRAYRTKTWTWSQIAWGTPLRDAAAVNDVLCQIQPGKWQSITTQYGISRVEIMNAYYDLWGRLEVAPTWVFNDFGPIAIRYFKDKNANGIRDRGEPLNRGRSARGQAFLCGRRPANRVLPVAVRIAAGSTPLSGYCGSQYIANPAYQVFSVIGAQLSVSTNPGLSDVAST